MANQTGSFCPISFGRVPRCLLTGAQWIGCTHSTENVIKVTDDTPFKEWFKWIPPPLIEEVHKHLWEMLDSGAIPCSQSAWCNTVVLVRKKGGSLHFCIDFDISMPIQKRTRIYYLGSKKPWKVWKVLVILHAWTWSPGFGKLKWMNLQNNTLHSPLAT